MRKPAPCTGFSSLRHRHSPKADTIRFGLALCRTAAVVALVLLAAPAFAVTTNISVAGVPPDQVQSVTLTVLGGATVQAERGDDDQTGAAVWVVDTPEAIPLGTDVAVNVRLVNGQTLFDYTTVRLDGAIAVDVEVLYTEALQSASGAAASAAESFTVQTVPGNFIKLIPDTMYPLPGVDYGVLLADDPEMRSCLNSSLWGIGPRVELNHDLGQSSNFGASGASDWRLGGAFDYSGLQLRYALNPGYTFGDSGMNYARVEDALQAVAPRTSGSVAQDSSQWCHYGSGEGHRLGYLGQYGDLLGRGPLRLEVNMSEDGLDDDAWTALSEALDDYLTGGATPALDDMLLDRLMEAFEEWAQEGHDQDPVQGVADENGTFSAGQDWTPRLGFRYSFDDSGGQGSGGGTQGNARPVHYRRGVRFDMTDLGDIESSNAWVREGDDDFWDVALRYAGEFGGIRIAATADGAAAGSTVDPGEWLTFTYPSSQSSEVARLLAQAGIETTNNSCRDKAPGPFLDWSDPNVESKYRSGSSGPEAFVLRLP